jgi:hypothetical protein
MVGRELDNLSKSKLKALLKETYNAQVISLSVRWEDRHLRKEVMARERL